MNKKFYILVAVAVVLVSGVYLAQNSAGTKLLWKISNEGTKLLPLVGFAALIDSINPCAFSILLLTIAFLFSIGKLRSGILGVGLIYVLGIFVVYMLIGLGILQALHIFSTPHFMARVGAILLIVLGTINLLGQFFPAFPIKLKIPDVAHKKMAELMQGASLPTAFLLGALVGLCEFPCTGGPYLMVLGLLHDQSTYAKGILYLLFYNLIFIIPLLIILFIASEKSLLDKVRIWQKNESGKMRLYGGIAMVLLGIIILLI